MCLLYYRGITTAALVTGATMRGKKNREWEVFFMLLYVFHILVWWNIDSSLQSDKLPSDLLEVGFLLSYSSFYYSTLV